MVRAAREGARAVAPGPPMSQSLRCREIGTGGGDWMGAGHKEGI